MECERLIKLIKNWYIQVQDEAMAPARMVTFIHKHVDDCMVCMGDPGLSLEIKKITELVLPPSKIPKAVRREEENQHKKEAADEIVEAIEDETDDDLIDDEDEIDDDEDEEIEDEDDEDDIV